MKFILSPKLEERALRGILRGGGATFNKKKSSKILRKKTFRKKDK